MSEIVRNTDAATYVPPVERRGELLSFVEAMRSRGREVSAQPVVIDGAGQRHELSQEEADLVVDVLGVLARGQAITIVPRHTLLTTQETADFLGISRPTLIKILERGELPFEMRGRHRRVRVEDLLEYQKLLHTKREEVLAEMQRDAQEHGGYDVTDSAPITRR